MLKKIALIAFLFIVTTMSNASHASCKTDWDEILKKQTIPEDYQSLVYNCGEDLRSKIFYIIKDNRYLDYKEARHYFFSDIDNDNGKVKLVYSETYIYTEDIPDHTVANCEHSWPQSMGATGKAKSDIHHLFPVRAELNTMRSNLPYCEVGVTQYQKYQAKRGYSSKSSTKCFEPPKSHKGDVARAMFYFSVRYNRPIDPEQEYWFRKWNNQDAVSSKERSRNDGIERYQNNRNPFIDLPFLVRLINDF